MLPVIDPEYQSRVIVVACHAFDPAVDADLQAAARMAVNPPDVVIVTPQADRTQFDTRVSNLAPQVDG